MAPASRWHLAALFAALHAIVSLCGPGHHALIGTKCHAAADPSGCATGDAAPCSAARSDARCLACDYFSQAQSAAVVAESPPAMAVSVLDRVVRPIPPPASPDRLPPSRGPPPIASA